MFNILFILCTEILIALSRHTNHTFNKIYAPIFLNQCVVTFFFYYNANMRGKHNNHTKDVCQPMRHLED